MGTVQSCTGDVCGASSCALPANTGSVDFRGLTCPQAAGDVSLDFDVTISKFVPSSLQTLEMDITAQGSAGKLMCAKINTSPALAEPRQYAKGFVRRPRNGVVPVGTITPEMRAAAPAKLDWTETAGAVSPVKDQAQCGSCWAFSATEGIESGVFQTTGTASPALAPQQIVSCDKTDGGCNGGDLPTAFDYVESAGGLDTEDDYPYTSQTGRSGSCKSSTPVVKVTDYKYAVAPCEGGSCSGQDEDGLKAALATHGPLSVCINAESWNGYYGGVLSGTCSGAYNTLDHCVQLVGYDTTASTPYWKVRNSWGTSWGESGFIRLPMGVNSCGIADEAMYVKASLAASVV